MMYQALYRKWRPQTFDDVFGQEHITRTLKNQVESNRVSHAYLFTGTRGTGKTSCAKILSRAVNCQHPVNGNPCNECPTCRGILDGSILDVLELDAASNTGVDNMRSILEETSYPPANARRRVYIIDEVHMLSAGAFNALLKTLEEPPEYVMFILATTELHRVAPTIMSRCQRFDFRRIERREIAANLSMICQNEGINITAKALDMLARLGDGSMRDAQSLLERCVNQNADRNIDEADVVSAMGISSSDSIASMADAIALQDAAAALNQLNTLYMDGRDVRAILNNLASYFRDVLLTQTAPDAAKSLVTPGTSPELLAKSAEEFTARRVMDVSRELQAAINSMTSGGNGRLEAELCLIKLCTPGLSPGGNENMEGRIAAIETRLAAGIPAATALPVNSGASETQTKSPPRKAQSAKPSVKPANEVDDKKRTEFLGDASRKIQGLYRPFIADARFFIDGDIFTIVVNEDFQKSMLDKDEIRNIVADAAGRTWNHQFRVAISTKVPEPKGNFKGFDDIFNEGREAGVTIDIK